MSGFLQLAGAAVHGVSARVVSRLCWGRFLLQDHFQRGTCTIRKRLERPVLLAPGEMPDLIAHSIPPERNVVMNFNSVLPSSGARSATLVRPKLAQKKRWSAQTTAFQLTSHAAEEDPGQRQAELFYLQKQIQSQTPMVVVLEDGEVVEGCIEWYDRYSLKVRGRAKTLIYKAAIKYMYKVGDAGQ